MMTQMQEGLVPSLGLSFPEYADGVQPDGHDELFIWDVLVFIKNTI